jgi:DNA primase
VSRTLQARFSDLLHRHVPGFIPRNGRGVVLCLFHQEKTPSLSIDLEKGVFHCFGCGVGGGVKKFAELVGELWRHSRVSPKRRRLATVYNFALAKAKRAYEEWQRQELINLTDQYRLLSDELEVTTIAYRAIHRQPNLYTTEEQFFWTRRLASLYDRLATLEHDLDLLTYAVHEAGRFAWWREEVSHV